MDKGHGFHLHSSLLDNANWRGRVGVDFYAAIFLYCIFMEGCVFELDFHTCFTYAYTSLISPGAVMSSGLSTEWENKNHIFM